MLTKIKHYFYNLLNIRYTIVTDNLLYRDADVGRIRALVTFEDDSNCELIVVGDESYTAKEKVSNYLRNYGSNSVGSFLCSSQNVYYNLSIYKIKRVRVMETNKHIIKVPDRYETKTFNEKGK